MSQEDMDAGKPCQRCHQTHALLDECLSYVILKIDDSKEDSKEIKIIGNDLKRIYVIDETLSCQFFESIGNNGLTFFLDKDRFESEFKKKLGGLETAEKEELVRREKVINESQKYVKKAEENLRNAKKSNNQKNIKAFEKFKEDKQEELNKRIEAFNNAKRKHEVLKQDHKKELEEKSKKNKVRFSINTDDSAEEAKIEIQLYSKCKVDNTNCPEGLFLYHSKDSSIPYIQAQPAIENQSDVPPMPIPKGKYPGEFKAYQIKHQKGYKGSLKYNINEGSININPLQIILDIINKQFSFENILDNLKCRYHLMTGKRHAPEYNKEIELLGDNGINYLDMFTNYNYSLMIDMLPAFEVETKLTLSEFEGQFEKGKVKKKNNGSKKSKKRKKVKTFEFLSSISHDFKIEGSVKVGKTKLQVDKEGSKEYAVKGATRKLDGGFMSKLAKNILSSSDDSATEGYGDIISFDLIRPAFETNLKLSLATDENRQTLGYDGELTIASSPLIGATVTIDLVSVLATYIGYGDAIAAMRESLASGKNNNIKIECEFSVEFGFNLMAKLTREYATKPEWDFDFESEFSTKPELKLEIKGEVKVWIASGAFEVQASIESTFNFKLRKSKKADKDKWGHELVFYHEGAEVHLKIQIKFESSEVDKQPTYIEFDKDWVIYPKLPEEKAKVLFDF